MLNDYSYSITVTGAFGPGKAYMSALILKSGDLPWFWYIWPRGIGRTVKDIPGLMVYLFCGTLLLVKPVKGFLLTESHVGKILQGTGSAKSDYPDPHHK